MLQSSIIGPGLERMPSFPGSGGSVGGSPLDLFAPLPMVSNGSGSSSSSGVNNINANNGDIINNGHAGNSCLTNNSNGNNQHDDVHGRHIRHGSGGGSGSWAGNDGGGAGTASGQYHPSTASVVSRSFAPTFGCGGGISSGGMPNGQSCTANGGNAGTVSNPRGVSATVPGGGGVPFSAPAPGNAGLRAGPGLGTGPGNVPGGAPGGVPGGVPGLSNGNSSRGVGGVGSYGGVGVQGVGIYSPRSMGGGSFDAAAGGAGDGGASELGGYSRQEQELWAVLCDAPETGVAGMEIEARTCVGVFFLLTSKRCARLDA